MWLPPIESVFPVKSLLSFYHINANQLLVAHDEIDLPPGTTTLKTGGSHGGHNGLRDIINQLGHVMGLKTIAEFVENESILKSLRRLDVDYAQGYVVMKPVPLEQELQRLRPSGAAVPHAIVPSVSGRRS